MQEKPIFLILRERKEYGYIKHYEFYKKFNQDLQKYFSKVFLDKFFEEKGFSKEEKNETLKKLLSLHFAQSKGCLEAQWDKFFAFRKKETITEVVSLAYEILLDRHKDFENFEKHLKEYNNFFTSEDLTL